MSYTLDAILAQAENNYPMTASISPEVLAVLLFAVGEIYSRRAWLDYEADPADEITPSDWLAIQELIDQCNMTLVTPEVGFIKPYITTDPPDNTIPCDGGTYAREDYPLLYAVIDSVFIIDADNFTVPNLNGRVIVGAGGAFVLGDEGGEETHALSESEMPSHNHLISIPDFSVPVAAPGEVFVPAVDLLPSFTGSTGGDVPHNNMQPYGVAKWCVQAR